MLMRPTTHFSVRKGEPVRDLIKVPRRSRHVMVTADGIEAAPLPYAGTYLRRLRGLLLGGDELLLYPCNSVHGFGIRRALEVAYIDAEGVVIEVTELRSWRAHRPRRGARVAWEAPPGRFHNLGVVPGCTLKFAPV